MMQASMLFLVIVTIFGMVTADTAEATSDPYSDYYKQYYEQHQAQEAQERNPAYHGYHSSDVSDIFSQPETAVWISYYSHLSII